MGCLKLLPIFLLLTQLTFAEVPEKSFPFIAKVTGTHVNVRSGPNLNFEVVTQLNQEDQVVVIKESYGWYRIEPPKTSSFWIFHEFVDEGVVNAYSVNIRSGPGTQFSVNTQVEKDDVVEIYEENGEWLRIASPKQAETWVHSDLVHYVVDFDSYQTQMKEIEEKNQREQEKKKLWTQAEMLEEVERGKSVQDMELDSVIKKYEEFKVLFEDDQEAVLKSDQKIVFLINRKQEIDRLLEESKRVAFVEKTPALEKGMVIYEGLLAVQGRLWSRSGQFKLVEGRNKICFIRGGKDILSPLVNQRVRITGQFLKRSKTGIPVIKLESVKRLE